MTAMITGVELSAFVQVLFVDLLLAGDNAVVVALAAAGLPRNQRRAVIIVGISLAVVLRIVLALLTVQLLKVPGLVFVGGVLLLWVAWRLAVELYQPRTEDVGTGEDVARKSVSQAMLQIVIADATMSLDNVLAVAAVARDHPVILVIGLALSVAFMGIAASYIASLLDRYSWIAWIGVIIIVWVAGVMIYDDAPSVVRMFGA